MKLQLNHLIDQYLTDGCGRCPLGGTPQCKVHTWPMELRHLRRIVLESGLTEERKWGVPCYTFESSNVAVVAAFKEYCSLSFFKGALLQDAAKILCKPGENTQSARLIRFTSVNEVLEMEPVLKEYIKDAIDVERKGLKVDFSAKSKLELPEELQLKFEEMPELEAAFMALTPGRQRGYLLHFSAAKQSKTRSTRIEKCTQQILDGKGFHD